MATKTKITKPTKGVKKSKLSSLVRAASAKATKTDPIKEMGTRVSALERSHIEKALENSKVIGDIRERLANEEGNLKYLDNLAYKQVPPYGDQTKPVLHSATEDRQALEWIKLIKDLHKNGNPVTQEQLNAALKHWIKKPIYISAMWIIWAGVEAISIKLASAVPAAVPFVLLWAGLGFVVGMGITYAILKEE